MRKLYRQGDVLLERMDKGVVIPADAKPVKNKQRIVLAFGEVTGHAHAIPVTHASEYEWQGNTLVHVHKKTKLVHEEHSAITLAPGIYKKTQQRQYTPERIINVAD